MTESGSFRVSDADRQQVLDVLNTAYAEGRINDDEHAERADATLVAKTFDDLAGITADLVPGAPTGAELVADTEPDRISTVMSTVKRNGPWRVRRRTVANNVLGDIHLDLTEAAWDDREIEINGTSFMGTLVVRVPIGTTVVDETTQVLGSTSVRDIGTPDPKQPTVLLRGTNVLGDIKVRGPKKPLPWGLSGRKAIA